MESQEEHVEHAQRERQRQRQRETERQRERERERKREKKEKKRERGRTRESVRIFIVQLFLHVLAETSTVKRPGRSGCLRSSQLMPKKPRLQGGGSQGVSGGVRGCQGIENIKKDQEGIRNYKFFKKVSWKFMEIH